MTAAACGFRAARQPRALGDLPSRRGIAASSPETESDRRAAEGWWMRARDRRGAERSEKRGIAIGETAQGLAHGVAQADVENGLLGALLASVAPA